MKTYTHPHISQSILISKDGSSFIKCWLYPRSILTLETSEIVKHWEDNKTNRYSRRLQTVDNFSEKIGIFNNKTIIDYWSSKKI